MNGYDTVFANANDEELEFETMFDQEDDLIDTIVGCNENGEPLTGAEPCPVATADERSSSDDNPDYEKDIDASDSKDAPKDAEGTEGYDFETEPEIDGKVDDSTTVDPKDVKVDEGFNFYLEEDEEEDSEDTDISEEVDFDITIPKDAEGTVGYDIEVNPEIGSRDDDSTVDPTEVKVDESFDFYLEEDEEDDFEGAEKTVPEEDPTVAMNDCGGKGSCKEGFDFSLNEADDAGVDKDVADIEDPDSYIDDDAIDDVNSKELDTNLEYDPSDEEVIDFVINN